MILDDFRKAVAEENLPLINSLFPDVLDEKERLAEEVKNLKVKLVILTQDYREKKSVLDKEYLEIDRDYKEIKDWISTAKSVGANARAINGMTGFDVKQIPVVE